MKKNTTPAVLLVAAALVFTLATPARAQMTGIEVGTALMSLTVNWGDSNHTTTTVGIPSGSFTLVNPGVYVSLFAGSHVAIEPQIGLVFVSSGGYSSHAVNFAGQFDYFPRGSRRSAPFVFGSVGVLSSFSGDRTPKSFGGGAGYRTLVADRVSIRLDGRIIHFTDRVGNAFVLGVSLGGVFKQR